MAAPRWRRDPTALLWAAPATAWLVLLEVPTRARADLLHHGAGARPVDGDAPPVGGSLLMWALMVATMLPAAAPALRSPRTAGTRQHRPAPFGPGVLAAYLVVWLGFGTLGLGGQLVLHAAIGRWPWLDQRPALLAAATLAVAGLYQFSPAKRHCLSNCRDPWRLDGRCRPGSGRIGLRLAVVSLGCCWAQMLAMLALGSIVTMVGLALGTAAETSTEWGSRVAGPLGVVLLYGAAALALAALATR